MSEMDAAAREAGASTPFAYHDPQYPRPGRSPTAGTSLTAPPPVALIAARGRLPQLAIAALACGLAAAGAARGPGYPRTRMVMGRLRTLLKPAMASMAAEKSFSGEGWVMSTSSA